MPSEGIRQPAAAAASAPALQIRTTVRGRTVRVHLAGILDRTSVPHVIQQVGAALPGPGCLIILDGAGLVHLDYRCVAMLVRWSRTLRSYRQRVCLDRWNEYLMAILAVEDWDGEFADRSRSAAAGARWEITRTVQVP
jgi:ABC-type transporter Mla MlaB component